MEIKELENLSLYNNFVKSSYYNHYMKSTEWGNLKRNKSLETYYLGFFESDNLIGTAQVFLVKGIVSYVYIPTGLCINYNNKDTLIKSLDLLKKYAKSKKVSFLRMDPNVIRVSRDINGNKTDEINNEFITDIFIQEGFWHKGYGYGYDGSFNNRFTLIVDISKDIETLKSNFSKQRQTALNRHNIIGLKTRIGNINDLVYLCEFEKELAFVQGFKPHSKNFFEKIINNFLENSRLYITEVNLDSMIDGTSKELNSKKYAKDLEARASKEKELKIAKGLKEKNGSNLVVGAGLFIFSNEKSWDLYTYNKKECNFLKPIDNLHYFAIQDMKSLNVKLYDMCGFSGSTSKDDPYYGLYNYKKSFNPDFIEMIGEFDYIINHNSYKLFLNITKGYNRIRRKLNSIIYKKD